MITGTGIDIVEIDRIQKAIDKNVAFKHKVFAEEEIAYCEKQGGVFQSFAGRYAAKEAFLKALGSGWRGELAFNEIVVHNNALGKPEIMVEGTTKATLATVNQIYHLSISHAKHYATAMVIIEKAG